MTNLMRAVVRWPLVALLVVAGTTAVSTQLQRPTTPATGLIVGRVVDAQSGAGIAGVLVTLTPATQTPSMAGELLEARAPGETLALTAQAGTRRILTAPDGRFLFRDLNRGRFNIFASSPRFLAGAFGQERPQGPAVVVELGDGQKLGNANIKLWKFGSISGTIRDEHGEPAVGVSVECQRRVISGGQRRYAVPTISPRTDDRGVFRVPNLPPGDYICGTSLRPLTTPVSVAAASTATGEAALSPAASRRLMDSATSATATGARVGDFVYSSGAGPMSGPLPPAAAADGRMMMYAPQYYGAANATTQAAIIPLKVGEEVAGIDIQLRLVPAIRISGTATGPSGPGSLIGFRLLPASGNDMVSEGQAEFARAISDSAGAFTFLGIPAGQYVLKARMYPHPAPGGSVTAALDETHLWVAMPITAGDRDITNLQVMLRAGIRLTGRVEFAGTRAQPTPVELQRIGVRVQNADGRTSSPVSLDGRVAADGTFKTAGYPAGRYIANVVANTIPAGWYVKSIMLGGRDISVEPVELTDADVAGAVVTFTDQVTSLSGTANGPKGPDPTAEVVVFPADSMAWKEIGVVARRGRVERVSPTGTFSFTGLPAGEYFVAAVAATVAGDRMDPALLATLMRDAARVTLAGGSTATVQVTVKR